MPALSPGLDPGVSPEKAILTNPKKNKLFETYLKCSRTNT